MEEIDLVVHDLNNNISLKGIVIGRRLQRMLYNIMYRMMFDAIFESQEDPLFVEATQREASWLRALSTTMETSFHCLGLS